MRRQRGVASVEAQRACVHRELVRDQYRYTAVPLDRSDNCAGRSDRAGPLVMHPYTSAMVERVSSTSRLADELGQAIDRGALRAGDRLPSVRRLAAGAELQRRDRARGLPPARERRPDRGPAQIGALRAPPRGAAEDGVEPRPPRACSRPSKVTVNDAYTEILAAMRDPALSRSAARRSIRRTCRSQQLNRIVTQVTREMTTVGARYEARARAAHAAPPDRAPRWSRPGSRSPRTSCARRSARPRALSLALRAVARPGDVDRRRVAVVLRHAPDIQSFGMRALEIPAHPRTGLRRRRVRGGGARPAGARGRARADGVQPARLGHARRRARAAGPVLQARRRPPGHRGRRLWRADVRRLAAAAAARVRRPGEDCT